MNLEYQYMVRPIPGKPRIDERRTFRRLRALVWTRARGLGGNFSRSPEKLLHRVKTARSCHRRFEATSAWEQRWNLQVQVVHIADEIETKRAANRVNLFLCLTKFSKFERSWKMNLIRTFDFLSLEESGEDDRVEIT